jgi:hypothetical protein
MGKDLYALLQHIHKIPTPPPTNNPQYTTEKYRSILVVHLSKINSINEFSHDVREIFIPVDDDSNIHKPSSAPSSLSSPSSQKSSLNFILNEEERGESSEIQNWDNVDPDSLINLPSDELQRKQNEACLFIANKIIRLYESTLTDQIKSEILRRRQFNNLILLLEYYEKLEVFCNLHLVRDKGKTVKSQATKMIVRLSRPSEGESAKIKGNMITQMIGQSIRIRRLLKIAANNYNIFYAFPDLQPQLFLPKKLSVANFERFLKLVKTGELPSVEEGKQLYNEYKEEAKKKRIENFNF